MTIDICGPASLLAAALSVALLAARRSGITWLSWAAITCVSVMPDLPIVVLVFLL